MWMLHILYINIYNKLNLYIFFIRFIKYVFSPLHPVHQKNLLAVLPMSGLCLKDSIHIIPMNILTYLAF